jgi:Uma2 family endonuclease
MGMIYSESMSHPPAERPLRHRYTIADYHRMGEAGVLAPDARVELIDGEIIDMPPIGFRHSGTVDKLNRGFVTACGERAIVRVQSSIQLGDYSEPQPDVTLLRPRPDFYTTGAAAHADALLVVEVAETSLRYDRDDKIPLYARHGIPEVWLVDLKTQRLVRYRNPQHGAYTLIDEPDLVSPLEIAALPETRLDLSTLFG